MVIDSIGASGDSGMLGRTLHDLSMPLGADHLQTRSWLLWALALALVKANMARRASESGVGPPETSDE
eukprot:3737243-Amphidinium_carterae.2